MDLASGLSAASTALGIVKDLREIDRGVDEASFKLKLAELTEALADARIALSDAREQLASKDREIRALEDRLSNAASGENCPICETGRMKTKRVVPHPTFGEVGVQEKHLECDNSECYHSEKRLHDPVGLPAT